MWITILRFDELSAKPQFVKLMPDLLEIAANRTINYTYDENNISKKFLDVDFDSTPDANSFCKTIENSMKILHISRCKDPENGLAWLENRLQVFFSSELGGKCINEFKLGEKSEEFNYGSSQLSTIDSHFTWGHALERMV